MSYRRDSASSSASTASYREALNEPRVPPSSQLMMHPEDDPHSPSLKGVRFDLNSRQRSHSAGSLGRPPYSEIQDKVMARQRKGAADLVNRLYDTSSNSQALAAVRQREMLMKKRKGDKEEESAPKDKMPRPPSGRNKPPVMTYRTTMFKSDYERLRKKNKDEQEPGKFEKIPPHL